MKEPSRQSIWYAEQRDLAIEERDIALNRARLAESKLADLEPTLSDWQARAEAAERRVQELEAQLAAMDDDEREDARHRAIINDVFGDDAKWGRDE